MYFHSRNKFGNFLNRVNLKGHGVEVGTYKGDYAAHLLETWAGQLYMVDPYTTYETAAYADNTTSQEQEQLFAQTLKRFERNPRAHMFRESSPRAADTFNDSTLDFVYLDGDHTFCQVLDELRAWWPKIIDGGILCGHDYNVVYAKRDDPPRDEWHCVEHAVKVFCKQNGLQHYAEMRGTWPYSYYIFKFPQQPVKEKLCVVTGYNTSYGELAAENHRKYCEVHGYQSLAFTEGFIVDREPHWSKWKFIAQAMEERPECEWIFWIDADAAFMNWQIKLERFMIPHFNMICTMWDYTDLKPDSATMLFRNNEWSREFVRSVLTCGKGDNHGSYDVNGLVNQYYNFPGAQDKIFGTHNGDLGSWVGYNQWKQPDEFIAHANLVRNKSVVLKDLCRFAAILNGQDT